MTSPDAPLLLAPRELSADWTVLPSFMPVPGMGTLAVNAFVRTGPEAMLVDTGLGALERPWLERLGEIIDPAELRWIWISHADADHVGNLARLLEQAPEATVLTSFLGLGKLAMAGFDASRMQVVEPGQALEIGAARIIPVRPPYYDAPETLGLIDVDGSTLFAADCFGALLPEPVAGADQVDAQQLHEGMAQWSAIDAPWLGLGDRDRLRASLKRFAELAPAQVLSAHLPPSSGGLDPLAEVIDQAWCASPNVPADPYAIEAVHALLHEPASPQTM